MRVSAIVLALAISAPAPAAGPAPAQAAATAQTAASAQKADNCPRTTSHFAGKGATYQGAPLAPKKLGELPPAVGYMAVYRTVDGCEIPMTVTEYRTGRR
jgi:hypothetical protein